MPLDAAVATWAGAGRLLLLLLLPPALPLQLRALPPLNAEPPDPWAISDPNTFWSLQSASRRPPRALAAAAGVQAVTDDVPGLLLLCPRTPAAIKPGDGMAGGGAGGSGHELGAGAGAGAAAWACGAWFSHVS